MPRAVRFGDISTGHGCWPPRPNDQASPNVIINGRGAHRVGDHWVAHTCPAIPETHDGWASAGSPNVYVNGRQLHRVGDPVSCGDFAAQGSPNVEVN